jgi:hypothetical protein
MSTPAPATAAINSPQKAGNYFGPIPIEAGVNIYAGTMVARNAAGNAVPASDNPGLRVLGIADENPDGVSGDYINVGGAAGAMSVQVLRDTRVMGNSATTPLGNGDVGNICFAQDNQNVTTQAGTNNKIAAGRFLGFPVDQNGNPVATLAIVDFKDRPANESMIA